MTTDISRHPSAELTAADGLGGMAQVPADELHAVAPVGAEQAVAQGALAGAAVDDGNEVIGDDESVFTFSVGAFGYDALFDNLHAFCNFIAKILLFWKKSAFPCIFLANCLFIPQKCYTFAAETIKTADNMLNAAYFYGYYFYFASNCEAVGRK